jgi:uncharacterized protein (DUF58 family)
VTDGRSRADLDTASPALQQRFASEFSARLERYREQLLRLGVPLLEASTQQAPLTLLRKIYGDHKA